MQPDEHDDDLATTVDQHSDGQTEDFPQTEEEFEDRHTEGEADDEDLIGK